MIVNKMFELRGVIIRRDGGDKYVRLIARKDHSDMYVSVERKANRPITRELIMAEATGHYGIPESEITWPHHVKVLDI